MMAGIFLNKKDHRFLSGGVSLNFGRLPIEDGD